MKSIYLVILIALLMAACTGTPTKIAPEQMQPVEQVAKTDGTETAKVEGKTYKKVCKTYATTGTRFEKKICRTEEAWDEIERKAKEALEKNTSMQSNNPTGG